MDMAAKKESSREKIRICMCAETPSAFLCNQLTSCTSTGPNNLKQNTMSVTVYITVSYVFLQEKDNGLRHAEGGGRKAQLWDVMRLPKLVVLPLKSCPATY